MVVTVVSHILMHSYNSSNELDNLAHLSDLGVCENDDLVNK